jgi:hypothetical protein
MFKKIVFPVLFFCLIQGFVLSQAQAADPAVLETVTVPKLLELLKGAGYEAAPFEDGIEWKIDGNFSYLFINLDENSNYLLFRTSGDDDGEATLQDLNRWNSTEQFSRSYLDDDGVPVLEADMNLAGGFTEAGVLSFLKNCHDLQLNWFSSIINAPEGNEEAGEDADENA